MPTMQELQNRIGVGGTCYTMGFHQSRTILNYLDKPVLAYGVGYRGFIAVVKGNSGKLFAAEFTKGKISGFDNLTVDEALNIIKTEKLLVETAINQAEIDNAKIIAPVNYQAPMLGTILFKQTKESYATKKYKNPLSTKADGILYRVFRNKDKKLRLEYRNLYTWNDVFLSQEKLQGINTECAYGFNTKYGEALKEFINLFERAKSNHIEEGDDENRWTTPQHQYHRTYTEIVSNTIPDDIIQEIKKKAVLESI